jgi:hypothetical protein
MRASALDPLLARIDIDWYPMDAQPDDFICLMLGHY